MIYTLKTRNISCSMNTPSSMQSTQYTGVVVRSRRPCIFYPTPINLCKIYLRKRFQNSFLYHVIQFFENPLVKCRWL